VVLDQMDTTVGLAVDHTDQAPVVGPMDMALMEGPMDLAPIVGPMDPAPIQGFWVEDPKQKKKIL